MSKRSCLLGQKCSISVVDLNLEIYFEIGFLAASLLFKVSGSFKSL